jgi:hypothetical protein
MSGAFVYIPIELDNGNTGRGGKWFSSAKERKKLEATLRALGFARDKPIPYQCTVTVTRVLGKGQRLWDGSSVLRGNWKEIEDSLVALGWWVDDCPKYIKHTDGRQDDTRRKEGPCVELLIKRVAVNEGRAV